MNNTKSQETVNHTPGPWTLETVETQIGICHKIGPFPPARANDKPSHACIYVDGRYKATDDPESLANARLISAAPDLLEACKVALEAMKWQQKALAERGEPVLVGLGMAMQQCDKAIEKASAQ